MELKERNRSGPSELLTGGSGGSAGSGSGSLDRATRLADAGDAAIDAALSEDPLSYLAQNRQEGGE